MAITVAMRTEVAQNYVALFGRAPDTDGLSYWVQQLGAGASSAAVAQAMYDTTPARAYFPGWMTNEEIVSSFYTNVLGRSADAEGLAYWAGRLAASSAGNVIREMVNAVVNWAPTGGANDAAGATAKALFNNKVAVANYWGTTVGTVAGSDTVIDAVTATTDTSSTAAIAAFVESNAAPVAGQTFTLTTSIESVTGGTGNDSFNAFINAATSTANTLQPGDSINGGNGTDSLALSITGTTGTTSVSGVTVTNVERIQVQNTTDATQTFDGVLTTGASTLATYGSSQPVTFSNVKNLVAGEMSYGSSNLTVTYSSAVVAGTSDAMTLNLTGQSAGTFSTTGIETLTVNTSGSAVGASTGNVSVGTTNTAISASVNAGVTSYLTLSDTSLKTIDASGSTASLTLDIATPLANQVVTMTGGSGNDTVTATGAGTTDVINLGDGTDTLVFTTTTGTTDLPLITNVEKVRVNATDTAAGVLDGTVVSGTTEFIVSMVDGTDNATDTTVAISDLTTQTVNVVASTLIAADAEANALTIAHQTDTTANSLALTLSGIGNSTTAFIQSVTANDAETITIATNTNSTGSTTSNKIASLVSTDATSLTISGAAALEITAMTAANLATVNAAGTTRAMYLDTAGGKSTGVTVTGGSANDTIDGGTGNDNITGGAGVDLLATGAGGNDVVSGGDGNDRIVVGSLSAGGSTETLDQNNGYVSLSGGAGNDVFVIASDMLAYTDTISGGDDTDTLELTYDATTTSIAYSKASTGAFKNVDVEKIQLTGGTALTITVADAGLASLGTTYFTASGAGAHAVDASGVLGGGGTVKFDASASTMTGAAVYTGGAATDNFIGGSGVNTLNYSNGVYLTASDTVSGGANVDELIIASGTAATITAAQLANVTGFEVIQLDADTGSAAATAMSITLSDAVAEANKLGATNTLFVVRENATVDTAGAYTQTGAGDDTGTTTINGSAVTGGTKLYMVGAAGADTITGGSGNDTITGAAGADSLIGGDGADSIVGGGGADTISGGEGNDIIFAAVSSGIDTIDVGSGTDRVYVADDAANNHEIITGMTLWGTSTVSGASGYDMIVIDESEFATINFANTGATGTLSTSDYNEIDGTTGTEAADKVNVITGTGYASYTAYIGGGVTRAGANEAFILFYNTSTQAAELWFDADADADVTEAVLVARIIGVGLNDMGSWAAGNFEIA